VKAPGAEALRRALPPALAALLDLVLAEAERGGLAIWLVGGPVRDLLLGRPLRDVDLVLEGHGDGGAEALARAAAPAGAVVVAHDRFGTVRVAAQGGALDLATSRRESYARPGALPRVEPGPIEEDLRRRDFSVNALALALSKAARVGREALLDPEGGVADLEACRLRVLHPRSFHDDPTRALRAARLAVRLRFRLDRGTRSALRDALRDGVFGGVSGDRIRRVLEKLFADAAIGQVAARALGLLAEWHVLAALEPGLRLPDEALAPLRRLARALAAPPWPPTRLRPWVTGLALWLGELEPPLRRRTLRRFAVRGEAAERVAEFPKRRDRWRRELSRARGRGAVDQLLARIDEESLLALWCGVGPGDRRRITRWVREDRSSRPPLSGADLVAAGLSGPVVGLALARVRSAFLDGAVRRREEALVLAHEVASRARRRPARRRRCPPGADRP
jgi:tRNA nucleotidyltransferase (CCA-adding enzyme)